MSIENITSYIQVSDDIATSGQPTDEQFKDIAAAGYKAVINLGMPDSENAIPEEGFIVSLNKMMYVHIPVPFTNPTACHLNKFLQIMQAFSEQKVWVHCVVNYRASAFIYQYQRLVKGLSDEEAKKGIVPLWQPSEVWQQFMALTNDELGLAENQ